MERKKTLGNEKNHVQVDTSFSVASRRMSAGREGEVSKDVLSL